MDKTQDVQSEALNENEERSEGMELSSSRRKTWSMLYRLSTHTSDVYLGRKVYSCCQCVRETCVWLLCLSGINQRWSIRSGEKGEKKKKGGRGQCSASLRDPGGVGRHFSPPWPNTPYLTAHGVFLFKTFPFFTAGLSAGTPLCENTRFPFCFLLFSCTKEKKSRPGQKRKAREGEERERERERKQRERKHQRTQVIYFKTGRLR